MASHLLTAFYTCTRGDSLAVIQRQTMIEKQQCLLLPYLSAFLPLPLPFLGSLHGVCFYPVREKRLSVSFTYSDYSEEASTEERRTCLAQALCLPWQQYYVPASVAFWDPHSSIQGFSASRGSGQASVPPSFAFE